MPAQKGKQVVRRRRERKNIERGAAHIQSTFNNTIVTITDTQGNAVVLGQLWRAGLPRLPEIHLLSPPRLPLRPPPAWRWSTA